MSNDNTEPNDISNNEDMLPEYDFTGGTRGKHYQAYRQGHRVTIHQEDGTTIVQQVNLEEGAVMLDPEQYTAEK